MQVPKLDSERNSHATILERIALGDKSAVEECIRTYNGLVWKIARKYSNNLNDAEDAVQEIFTSVWMNAARFDAAKSPESAFICLLAQRKAIDLFRKQRYKFSEIELTEADNLPSRKNGGHRNIFLNLDLKTVKQALKNLPDSENEFIRLSIYDGNSHNEIAERFGIPLGTVKSKIRRGLNKIRIAVGEPFLTDLREAYYG